MLARRGFLASLPKSHEESCLAIMAGPFSLRSRRQKEQAAGSITNARRNEHDRT